MKLQPTVETIKEVENSQTQIRCARDSNSETFVQTGICRRAQFCTCVTSELFYKTDQNSEASV